MARWKPADVVSESEVLGRRIFDKDNSELAAFELVPNIFYDSRLNDDLSFDRLGNGELHLQTVGFLTPLCDDAADKMKQSFLGWVAARKKSIKFAIVKPDPLTLEKDGEENPYHALLDRSQAREKSQAFYLSRSLLMDFKEKGQFVQPVRKTAAALK